MRRQIKCHVVAVDRYPDRGHSAPVPAADNRRDFDAAGSFRIPGNQV
jgi:hypothetical protein